MTFEYVYGNIIVLKGGLVKTCNNYDVNNFFDLMDRYIKGEFKADSQSMLKLCNVITENMNLIDNCAGNLHEREKIALFSSRIKSEFSDNAEIVKVSNNISSSVNANFFNVEDTLKHIFSYLLPINESQYYWSKSNLKDTSQVSKFFYKNSNEVKLKWIQKDLVSLKSCGINTADELVDYIITHNLKHINICRFRDFNETHLKKLAKQEILSLKCNSSLINEWPAMETLEYFNTQSESMTDTALAKFAKACPNLKGIHLDCWYLTDTGLIDLACSCPNLSSIFIFGAEITDTGLAKFAELCPKLTTINLVGSHITDKGVIELAKACHNLVEVDLTYCGLLTDTGIIELAKGCRELKDVKFTGSKVTVEGVMEFIKLSPNLSSIDVRFCLITIADLKKIKESYPNLLILG